MDMIGNESEWTFRGTSDCGKGRPARAGHTNHPSVDLVGDRAEATVSATTGVSAHGSGKVRGIAADGQLVNGKHVPTVQLAASNLTGGTRG